MNQYPKQVCFSQAVVPGLETYKHGRWILSNLGLLIDEWTSIEDIRDLVCTGTARNCKDLEAVRYKSEHLGVFRWVFPGSKSMLPGTPFVLGITIVNCAPWTSFKAILAQSMYLLTSNRYFFRWILDEFAKWSQRSCGLKTTKRFPDRKWTGHWSLGSATSRWHNHLP